MVYTKVRYYLNVIKYSAVSDPMKTIWVKTDSLTHKNTGQEFPGKQGLGYIRAGDWDQSRQKITDIELYYIYHRRFVEDKPWRETGILEQVQQAIERKGDYYSYTTTEEVLEHRCPYIDELYHRIKNEGYKTQEEAQAFLDDRKHTDYTPLEILVNISRDGEILFYTGHNRMMLAKIIGVEEIPVQVMARHEKWQRTREKVADGNFDKEFGSDCELRQHPDLQDIL